MVEAQNRVQHPLLASAGTRCLPPTADRIDRELQYVAYRWLGKFIARWRHDLPAWRLAILVGRAKRLALNEYLIDGRQQPEVAPVV